MSLLDQQASTERLHRNVEQVLRSKFPTPPINGMVFNVSNVRFDGTDMSHEAQIHATDNDLSMEERVRANITATKDGKVVGTWRNVVLARLPQITDRGTYIVKGNEHVMLNSMDLHPGVYIHPLTEKDKTQLIRTEVRAGKQRFMIDYNVLKPSMYIEKLPMEFGKTNPGKLNVFAVLRVLGATDQEIEDAVGDQDLYQQLKSANEGNNSVQKIFSATHISAFPGEAEAKEKIADFFTKKLTFGEAGQGVNAITLGQPHESFDKGAFLNAIRQMMLERREPNSAPSVDDLRFKEISSGEDLIADGFEKGVDSWMNNVLRPYANSRQPGEKKSARPLKYIDKGVASIVNGNYMELAEVPNPLALFQSKQKITVLGQGGLTTRSAKQSNRDLQDTAFAKIDPIETPQSDKLGLIQHLAKDAKIVNGRIYSSFYRVHNGVVDRSQLVTDLDPMDEYQEYVAFHDPRQLETVGGNLALKGDPVRVRHQGKFIEVSPQQVTYIDKSPSSVLGYAASLIPFGGHNDGARMLMGANMQGQAMSLKDPEAPLVQSVANEHGKTVEEEVADHASFLLRANVSGKIKAIGDDFIEIATKDGVQRIKKLNYFSAGKMGGYINHRPVVKVGDTVKEGDLLADGWQSDKGRLALGKNVLTAFMPYEGYNFEDGVAASTSFADKMASEEIKVLEYAFPKEMTAANKDAVKILRLKQISPDEMSKLDNDGIIKKGSDIATGDVLVAAVRLRKTEDFSQTEMALNRLTNGKFMVLPGDQYEDKSKRVEGYQKGKVIDVKKIPQADGSIKVTIKLLSDTPMQVGDKLAGRHGNKGTITKIIPDAEMPKLPDGRPVELMFSPLAVPSRKNLGQLLEVNAGLIAERKGDSVFKVKNFDPSERERVMKGLKEIGVPHGKMHLHNPVTGKDFENPITVGPMYIMKLKHKVEGKITARNYDGEIDPVTLMPRKVSGSVDGDRTNPQGVGGMEFWSLTSGGAVHNVHEMTTLKSDGAGDRKARKEIFDAIRLGTKIPEPVTPQTLKVLKDKLLAAGVDITPLKDNEKVSADERFTSLMLLPATQKAMAELNPKTVTNKKGIVVTKIDTEKPYAEGGLYDPAIFGEDKDKWGRINIKEPMPNPLYLEKVGPRPYEAMLFSKGLTNDKLLSIMESGKFVVLDPKDTNLKKYQLVDVNELIKLEEEGKKPTVDTGSGAMNALLKEVDLKDAYENALARMRDPEAKLADRSRAEVHMRVLANAIENNLTPEDYLLHYIPVLPTKYRPVIQSGPRTFSEDGITRLYSQAFDINKTYGDMHDKLEETFNSPVFAHLGKLSARDIMLPETYADSQKARYAKLKHIIGVGETFKDRSTGQEWYGIMDMIKSKHGFLRENMQKKMQDYSGRSVITVDPTLELNEVGLPEDMVAEIFNPHIRHELRKKNYTPEQIEDILTRRDQRFRDAAVEATKEHPVILNRQPSLHRHSMQAFFPRIRWNDKRPNLSIGLNPLVTTGFNADFDGDTMPVHVPLTEAAKAEAIAKLMPSNNLLNPTNNSMIMELKHEMQLGIYYMTLNKEPEQPLKHFSNPRDLEAAYKKGEVSTYQAVEMTVPGLGTKTTTAGQHLFNAVLPPKYQDYTKNIDMDNRKVSDLIGKIIADKSPGMGPDEAVRVINKLKNISFKVSTISGMSIGVTDFDPLLKVKEEKNLFEDEGLIAEARRKLAESKPVLFMSAFTDEALAFEQEKSRLVRDRLEKIIRGEDVLEKHNPVKIMQASGARGNAGQINSMAGVIGVGKSVTNQATRPVNSSHLEGLSPQEFWDLSYDSRKGIFDKSIATRDPGALTRQVWMANKQTIISEHDCGDREGVRLNMKEATDRAALKGRVLLDPVTLKSGKTIAANQTPLTLANYEDIIAKYNGLVHVRSPLSCKSTLGVCQLCYGARAGAMQNELVPIGEAVGSIAAQAIGEPSQQAIMKTFHTGAGNSNVSGAFERIAEVLYAPKELNKSTKAVLVQKAGSVTKIVKGDSVKGNVVHIDDREYALGEKPMADGIVVGATYQPGDSLTKEKEWIVPGKEFTIHTFRDPREVLRLQGEQAAKHYLLTSLEDALHLGDIKNTDRRHLEVVVGNMTNHVRVTDGGSSPYAATRLITRKEADRYNTQIQNSRGVTVPLSYTNRLGVVGSKAATDYPDRDRPGQMIVRKGEVITDDQWNRLMTQRNKRIFIQPRPLSYETTITGAEQEHNFIHNPNWLSGAAHEEAPRTIGSGAALGMTDELDNPLTRQMTGLLGNFGDEFHTWKDKLEDKLHFRMF